ncbi:hypothetical protein EVAR_23232_1 [Eumeta japonica]|uniref:Uncharacterized protein n=1 Tax=Eumeta variegata TaxID=151549 RepID=A0A4C1VEF1_EUMVA|nr:hypothetical protein EVAR_23232_1 [Eumeta japonica]
MDALCLGEHSEISVRDVVNALVTIFSHSQHFLGQFEGYGVQSSRSEIERLLEGTVSGTRLSSEASEGGLLFAEPVHSFRLSINNAWGQTWIFRRHVRPPSTLLVLLSLVRSFSSGGAGAGQDATCSPPQVMVLLERPRCDKVTHLRLINKRLQRTKNF